MFFLFEEPSDEHELTQIMKEYCSEVHVEKQINARAEKLLFPIKHGKLC